MHYTHYEKPYEITNLMRETAKLDRAAGMAFFLLEHTGTIYGKWRGRMKAADQRLFFGRFVGKGQIIINGDDETVSHNVSVCFGTMRDTVWTGHWYDLVQ